jgi:hypothetical protein
MPIEIFTTADDALNFLQAHEQEGEDYLIILDRNFRNEWHG